MANIGKILNELWTPSLITKRRMPLREAYDYYLKTKGSRVARGKARVKLENIHKKLNADIDNVRKQIAERSIDIPKKLREHKSTLNDKLEDIYKDIQKVLPSRSKKDIRPLLDKLNSGRMIDYEHLRSLSAGDVVTNKLFPVDLKDIHGKLKSAASRYDNVMKDIKNTRKQLADVPGAIAKGTDKLTQRLNDLLAEANNLPKVEKFKKIELLGSPEKLKAYRKKLLMGAGLGAGMAGTLQPVLKSVSEAMTKVKEWWNE